MRVPPALAQVSVQTVSVRAQLASQQVSSQQAARVESRSPLWRELAQASLRAAYEQLPVCLASYVPPGGLRSYSPGRASAAGVAGFAAAAGRAATYGFAPGAAFAVTALCCSSARLVAGRATAAWVGTP